MDALLQCVAEARSGRGRVVLVSGEAGIGKSRLVAEVHAHAERADTRVLQGQCFEPDRTLPYAPLQDLLQSVPITRSPDAIVEALGPAAFDLAPLLPALADRLPASRRAMTRDPEQEKRRLLLALSQLVVHYGGDGPLLLVVEDVHWGDDASLDFVEHLARQIAGHPLVLLLTFRTDEVSTRLATLLTELDRSRVASEVRLSRLERGDVDAMVRTILGGGRPVPAILLDAIYRLTDGNPFFVEEIVRSLVADGISPFGEPESEREVVEQLRIPRSVEEAVRRRFDGLSPGARQMVTLAAVAGRHFDLPLLQALQDREERQLLEHLKELLAAQLVLEESADRFAFRHALTRQAIYARLLALERRAYHQMIAESIERIHAADFDAHLADLSYHTFAAGQWHKALDYGRHAGEAALRLHATRAAIEHFSRAIAAADELSRTCSPSLYGRADLAGVPPDLYCARGQAYGTIGDFERARSDLETALALARSGGDRRAEWQILINLGFLWAERDYAQTGDFYQRASDVAQALADPLLHARSLNRLGNWSTNLGRAQDALSLHREALALFIAQGDDRGEAETQDLLGMTYGLALGDAIASAAHYDRAITLVRAFDDTATLASSLTARAAFCNPFATETLFSPLTQRDECVTSLEAACALARQSELPAALAFAEYVLGQTLAGYGEFSAALTHASEGLRIATEIDHQQWQCGAHCMLGVTHVAMLAPDQAFPHLETALALGRTLGSAWWIGMGAGYLALAHLFAGFPSRAELILTEVLPPAGVPRNAGERRTVWACGELALARGNPEEALRIVDDLIASAPGQTRSQPIPTLMRLRGEALLALRRLDEAERALEDAKLGAIQRGATPLLWPVHRALVRLRLALRQPASAWREWTAARDVIDELAASIVAEPERERFAQTALASLPALPKPRPPSRRQRDAERYGGLTPRERDVAAQVALGKTNREIAASIFTAERTVASHVGSILTKLGFSSRAQIAVWAREHNLTGPR